MPVSTITLARKAKAMSELQLIQLQARGDQARKDGKLAVAIGWYQHAADYAKSIGKDEAHKALTERVAELSKNR